MKDYSVKVVCAMSGGIDSSVAAALLKRAGYNVIGVFMKFWSARQDFVRVKSGGSKPFNRCCSPEAENRARKVAKILKIPFYVFNFEKEFKKRVVDYFLEEYRKGTTPNPCVVCNKEIKFGLLLEKAKKMGIGFLATGHYVKISNIKHQKSKIRKQKSKVIYKLLRAKDKDKDQTYFLWQLNQNQLKHILFPIGEYTKKQVKGLAKEFKLPMSGIQESQEVCFIQNTCNRFLAKYLKKNPGNIINSKEKIIGRHNGLWFYTIGQRKGINISGRKPLYVLKKDIKKNILIVTENKKDLENKELIVKDINWLSGKAPKLPLKIMVKVRYRACLSRAKIIKDVKSKKYKVIFDKPQRAITIGQSVVFYKGQELLGGGIIKS
ncbi:tRNA 2-thiouridine(34) synthase MnmA [Candidatus Atribacteria bacterium MT.SAG.1]|nr:tRNA 2-thiouridine(34) synthase MnmA [Candidatus Atribacteria bacterium MT.SAG.1]